MRCIVNGSGEMTDADFEYVGRMPREIDLDYVEKVVKKDIPNREAVVELVELVKEYDMWKENDDEDDEKE